eukprot:5206343-Pyramimonas_sp.AAC.1
MGDAWGSHAKKARRLAQWWRRHVLDRPDVRLGPLVRHAARLVEMSLQLSHSTGAWESRSPRA